MTNEDEWHRDFRRGPSLERVIRTDFYPQVSYFDELDSPRSLSAAWLGSETAEHFRPRFGIAPLFQSDTDQVLPDRNEIDATICIQVLLTMQHATPDAVTRFIKSAQQSLSLKEEIDLSSGPILATAVLNERIVIERSPPIAETLMSLVHSATSTSLGILMGTSFSTDPYVMIVTVPAGIVFMGTVLGLTKGLERGVAKRVEKAINPPATRVRRKPTPK